MFDACAGLLISPPHHQLAASHSVSQTTEFTVICRARGQTKGKVNVSKSSSLLTSSSLLFMPVAYVYYVMCLSLFCLTDLLISCDMCHLREEGVPTLAEPWSMPQIHACSWQF